VGNDKPTSGAIHAGGNVVKIDAGSVSAGRDININLGLALPKPPLHNLPPLTKRFVERPTELDEVHRVLTAAAHKGAVLRAGYRGHGGQGKSTLALAYAWKCRDELHLWFNSYPGGTYQINCGGGSILAEIAALARACGAREEQDTRQTAANVKAALESGPTSLIILDNVTGAAQWNGDEFAALLPQTECRYLITTREAGLSDVEEVPVGYLTQPQAVELLGKFKPIPANTAEQDAAAHIAEWLGGLAVAVAAVGSTLRRTKPSTYAAYWAALQKKKTYELPGGDKATAKEIKYEGRAAAVVDDAITSLDPAQRRCVDYAAVLPPDMAPKPWLVALLSADAARPEAEGGIALEAIDGVPLSPAEAAVQRLIDDGALTPGGEGGQLLSLHRLWHARVNERAEAAGEGAGAAKVDRTSLLRAIAACAAARSGTIVKGQDGKSDGDVNNPAALTDQSLRWELTPLAQMCAALWQAKQSGLAARVGVWLAPVLRQLGRYAEAAACLQLTPKNEAAVEAAIGHEDLAHCYSNLALIQQAQGDLPGARGVLERAIAIDSKHFASDHPAFAIRYSVLALIQKDQGDLYKLQGKFTEAKNELATARANIERAIVIDSKHFAPDHSTFATRYSNLATIQQDEGHLSKSLGELNKANGSFAAALASISRAIKIGSDYFGLDHPNLATMSSNLALIQKDQGDLPGARVSMERAIAIWSNHLPAEHPAFALAYNNLAHICFDEGNRMAACANFKRALDVLLRHFDEDHGDVMTIRRSMKNVGCSA